jgi:hypothetical protein
LVITKLFQLYYILGYTQLKVLDDEAILNGLSICLPQAWIQEPDKVTWDPNGFGQPPQEWLGQLWEYLTKQHYMNLLPFEKLPLIPVKVYDGKTDLVPLANKCSLICRDFDGASLDQTMTSLLEKLGVTVIEELPSFIKAHPLVTRKYTFTPTAIGVLKSVIALTNITGLPDVLNKITNLKPEEKRSLRLLFSKIYPHELKTDYRDVLRHLPLFETMSHESKDVEFISCVQVIFSFLVGYNI